MFDEPSHYVPPPAAPKSKPTPAPIPINPPVVEVPVPLPSQRPLWMRATTAFFSMVVLWRLCNLSSDLNSVLDLVVQSLHVGALMVILLGLWAMRRWAGVLFVIFCFWTALSSVMIGIARLQHLELVESLMDRDSVMVGILFDMGFAVLLYGVLGLGYAVNLRHFVPAGRNRYGNIPFVLLISTMLLYTGSQISQARQAVELRAEAVQESRDWLNDWLD